jgi:hypothetical protein
MPAPALGPQRCPRRRHPPYRARSVPGMRSSSMSATPSPSSSDATPSASAAAACCWRSSSSCGNHPKCVAASQSECMEAAMAATAATAAAAARGAGRRAASGKAKASSASGPRCCCSCSRSCSSHHTHTHLLAARQLGAYVVAKLVIQVSSVGHCGVPALAAAAACRRCGDQVWGCAWRCSRQMLAPIRPPTVVCAARLRRAGGWSPELSGGCTCCTAPGRPVPCKGTLGCVWLPRCLNWLARAKRTGTGAAVGSCRRAMAARQC